MAQTSPKRAILVYAHWEGIASPAPMGVLRAELLRGKEVFSFEYDADWLRSAHCREIDPALQLYSGVQYHSDQKQANFGLFLDSSPDRWGRVLMRRREAAAARSEGRAERVLRETDYLLGVYDELRIGGLRFKTAEDEDFLSNDETMSVPPWSTIRTLEEISLKLESEGAVDDPEYLQWLNMLLAPGSSLGGARPKAGVVDPEGNMWIAKFPSGYDQSDVGGWEMVAHQLAQQAGIEVPDAMARRFTSRHHTFLVGRFDRRADRARLHFASAMTLLGYNDGADHDDNVSYLELAEFITGNCSHVDHDLEELWRRIVFSICISNTDDHLRNHGFILDRHGWRLSPAFDVNPNELGRGLKLNISETDNSLDLGLAMEVHEYFRLRADRAKSVMVQVQAAVKLWRKVAEDCGISRSDQELKASAFWA